MATNNVLIQKYQGATSGYNQINPLTVDEDLNTRIGFASGSTSKDIIDYNSQFWWKRRNTNNTYIANGSSYAYDDGGYTTKSWAQKSCFLDCDRYSASETIYYSDSYSISSDGKFVLDNEKTLTIVPNTTAALTSMNNALVGKYIKRNKRIAEDSLVYIPIGNRIEDYAYGSNNYYYFYPGDNVVIYNIQKTTNWIWEKVSSNSYSTYPTIGEQGDYYYEYIGNPLKDWENMAKIDFGEYIGTGDSEFTFVFDFLPKLVIVVPESGTYSLNISGESLYAVLGSKTYSSFYRTAWTGGSVDSGTKIYFEWKENSFHATNVSGLNQVNKKYQYIAFG